MRSRDPKELVTLASGGDRAALARLISVVERGGEPAREVARLTWPQGGKGYSVGITGAPGAGKSTLTDKLITAARARGDEIGVVAIDPSSPRTGGAFLGDRARMQEHALDQGVYIRSMGTRGDLGGLSVAVPDVVRAVDAAGFPWILIETVGVGQVEVDIAETADTTVVVVNPGYGDAIQASKAGLLEVADVFVINKSDRPGAEQTRRDIMEHTLARDDMAEGDWLPPVVMTVASDGTGVEDLWQAIRDHRAHLEVTGELEERRRQRITDEVRHLVAKTLEQQAYALMGGDTVAALLESVVNRTVDPHTAAEEIIGS